MYASDHRADNTSDDAKSRPRPGISMRAHSAATASRLHGTCNRFRQRTLEKMADGTGSAPASACNATRPGGKAPRDDLSLATARCSIVVDRSMSTAGKPSALRYIVDVKSSDPQPTSARGP